MAIPGVYVISNLILTLILRGCAGDSFSLLTLGVQVHKGYSTSFVCLSVCMYVCMSVTTSLAHLVAKSIQSPH